MKKHIFAFLFMSIIPFFPSAQYWKKKSSFDTKKTLTIEAGSNKTWYGESAVNSSGAGYDLTMKNTKAKDLGLFNKQFNAGIAYYFADHWAISLNYFQTNYLVQYNQEVLVNGSITPGTDASNFWSGSYFNDAVELTGSNYSYQNKVSQYQLGIIRTDQLYRTRRSNAFYLSINSALNFGMVQTTNSFRLGSISDNNTSSLSGSVVNLQTGLRFGFFKYVYIQTSFAAGYTNLTHVSNRSGDANAVSKQHYLYTSFQPVIGLLFKLKAGNDCNTCPKW